MFKHMEESKKQSTLIKSILLQTNKKQGKAGKPGVKGGNNKKPAAKGSKGKNAKRRQNAKQKQKPKAASTVTSDDKTAKDSKADDGKECKLTPVSSTYEHPSSHGSCGCGASMDYTVSSIPRCTDWPVSFPLQSAVEYVSATGLQPETIVSRLSMKLGGRIAHSEDSYRKIGAHEKHIDIIRNGYKPTWIKRAPRQRITSGNPTISSKAAEVLEKEVQGLLEKGAIQEVGLVQGQYVSSYFAVPKSKRSPDKWRPILNLKKSNKYICHIHFQMEDPKLSGNGTSVVSCVQDWILKMPFSMSQSDPKSRNSYLFLERQSLQMASFTLFA